MVQGRLADFCEMQEMAQASPPINVNQINQPWNNHPGMPMARLVMKNNLTRLLPEWPVSKIDELNTLLETFADSKETYEDLQTLNERVLQYDDMRQTVAWYDEFSPIHLGFQAYNYGFKPDLYPPSIALQGQQLEIDSSESRPKQKSKRFRSRHLMRVLNDVNGGMGADVAAL